VDKACPCCGGQLHLIGEDKAEMLDYVPAHLRVRVTRRPCYACRSCAEGIVQAPPPDRPIDGCMATEALLWLMALIEEASVWRHSRRSTVSGVQFARLLLNCERDLG
jgi:transposase